MQFLSKMKFFLQPYISWVFLNLKYEWSVRTISMESGKWIMWPILLYVGHNTLFLILQLGIMNLEIFSEKTETEFAYSKTFR